MITTQQLNRKGPTDVREFSNSTREKDTFSRIRHLGKKKLIQHENQIDNLIFLNGGKSGLIGNNSLVSINQIERTANQKTVRTEERESRSGYTASSFLSQNGPDEIQIQRLDFSFESKSGNSDV